ncbi:GH3 auxin-responsive promoter family protein [Apibacter muscae]|uniref:GH3 family domain-containing protein n=1 Tax=Apibacter muscae TaxID=2509004 RepID=UPI0011ACAB4C|nr:GH3 auxin-responsive promoter family protein [Apibacter muscae]TWP22857.1 GH3 auxin-responsive promoter family protein [Apibacter muscae]
MSFLKSKIANAWASFYVKKDYKWIENPVDYQNLWFKKLIKDAENTTFGKAHYFSEINNIKDFQERVTLQDYESLVPYIDKIKKGEKDILYCNKPQYLAKTSGTTSGTKYIPVTEKSMTFQVEGVKGALMHYIHKFGNSNFINGKMIFLQGSPKLEELNGLKIGRLSGISAHFVPKYLQRNRLPSWETNCIEDWETKVDKIVDETINQNMTLIGGIPPWLVMYFEKLIERSGKPIKHLFPNLQLLVTGGVNYNPYQEKLEDLMGQKIDTIQTYPASEGFIGFQDDVNSNDLLLMVNHGIFYEFVPAEEIGKNNPTRLTLKEVELNKDYAIILTTNAGLWAYEIGDLIRFVHLKPYKIIVSGRTKHFTSAFGEHVISCEVEESMQEATNQSQIIVTEFTLAPQVNPKEGLPYHEWFIEFENYPTNLDEFALELDNAMRKRNSYYDDLISGNILRTLKITPIQKNGFNEYMKEIGKLGAQNKLPRLSNDRKIADKLIKYML